MTFRDCEESCEQETEGLETMTYWRPTTDAALAGWFFSSAFNSLYQDAMGLERFVAKVRERWVDPVYSIPVAVSMLVFACYLFSSARKQEGKAEK